MRRCAWLIAVGVVAAAVGIAPLVSGGGKVESLAAPSLSSDVGRPDAAADDNGVHVMLNDAGLWVTYTHDGEGNPIYPGSFALDITTGDMWFLTGGEVVELSAAGEWARYSVEDFGYTSSRYFTAIAVDEEGNAWLGMCVPYSPYNPHPIGGVIVIAPDGTWTDYTGQLNGCIWDIVADRTGNKWFYERDYITRFDGESWQADYGFLDTAIERHYEEILTTIDQGYQLWYVEPPDKVWCFDWLIGRGVNVYDGSGWTTYTPEDGLADEIAFSMGVDGDGRKWFGVWEGISVLDDNGTLDKSDDVWTTFDTMEGGDVAVDGEGKVWIAVRDPMTYDGMGVAVWDGSNWSIYDTTNSGLPHDWVCDIIVDGEDVKWFGTSNGISGGLTKLFEDPAKYYSARHYFPFALRRASP